MRSVCSNSKKRICRNKAETIKTKFGRREEAFHLILGGVKYSFPSQVLGHALLCP